MEAVKVDNIVLSDFFANLKQHFKEKYKAEAIGFSLISTLYDGVYRIQVFTTKSVYENLVAGEYLNSVNGSEFKEVKNGK